MVAGVVVNIPAAVLTCISKFIATNDTRYLQSFVPVTALRSNASEYVGGSGETTDRAGGRGYFC